MRWMVAVTALVLGLSSTGEASAQDWRTLVMQQLDAAGEMVRAGGQTDANVLSRNQVIGMLEDGGTSYIEIRLEAKEGWSAAQGRLCVVVLSTELNEALIQEGVVKDVVRAIQDQRKEVACAYTDRILAGIVSQSNELTSPVRAFSDYIQRETLADDIRFAPIEGVVPVKREAGGHEFELYVKVVT